MKLLAQPAGLSLEDWFDLGEGHDYKFVTWNPDFALGDNAKWAHLVHLISTHPVVGANVRHRCKTETGLHEGFIFFRTELTAAGPFTNEQLWDVRCWAPLHVEPSLLSHCACADHGFIRGGKWQRA